MRSFVAILLGATILAIATPAVAQAPSYISSMASFQVRNLTGSFAPTDGATLQGVTPSEWVGNDPGNTGLVSVIIAWSGGAKALTGTRLFVHGGGHHDSANNGLYIYDFSGTSRPIGWSLAAISPLSAVQASDAYSDGKPRAVHTYDGSVFAHHNGMVYRFGGSQWDNGFFTTAAWQFNPSTSQWTRLPNAGGATNEPITIYDAASGKILLGWAWTFDAQFFRTANNTWSGVKNTGVAFNRNDQCGAWDSTRGRGLIVGGGQDRVATINWSAETISLASQSLSGLPSITGPSCFYDQAADRYWVFGGSTNSSGWSTIYEINAGNFSVTPHGLTGDSIARASGMIGSYGRFVFLAPWRAIGVVANINSPASIIKLPAAGPPGVAPMAPSSVQLN
jgi:hypothetical protein